MRGTRRTCTASPPTSSRSCAPAVEKHLRLAAERTPGETLVQVRDESGSGGTSVEIVTDDMPFLVGAVLVAVSNAGTEVRRLVHPIVVVRRAGDGELAEVLGDADPADPPADTVVESWIHLDLDPVPGTADELEKGIAQAIAKVRRVVGDGGAMTDAARALAERLTGQTGHAPADRPAEIAQFLHWLVDGHFTFIGHRAYAADGAPRDPGLGVLRDDVAASDSFAPRTATIAGGEQDDLVVTRASAPSPLRATVHPYVVAVVERDEQGVILGEHRFLGTLTVPALYESVLDIPVVEHRVRDAIRTAGFPLESYSGQRMLEVISALPREELFSASQERLHDTAVGVLAVTGRRAVRVFLRPDPYRRFISCLVYLPRDRYTTSSRLRDGRRAAAPARRHVGRLHRPGLRVAAGAGALHGARRPGRGRLRRRRHHGPAGRARRGRAHLGRPPARRGGSGRCGGDHRDAGGDPGVVQGRRVAGARGRGPAPRRGAGRPGRLRRAALPGTSGEDRRFTLYLAGEPATLTAVLPVLQQLGMEVLDERPAELTRPDGLRVHVYDFGLRLDEPTRAAVAGRSEHDIEAGFCSAFRAAWRGDAESDRFSALVLRAGLPWREVAVLRAYARYARQLGSPFGHQYMATPCWPTRPWPARWWSCSARGSTRRSPATAPRRATQALADVRELIDAVTGLDADRILRSFLGMITATLRTNFYRQRPFLSFKIDPSRGAGHARPAPAVRDLRLLAAGRGRAPALRAGRPRRAALVGPPAGLPHRDPRAGQGPGGEERGDRAGRREGRVRGPQRRAGPAGGRGLLPHVHLRAARRHRQPGHRSDGRTETVPPPDVVRHDGDDSYLVVAADKGTAKFSDIANEVAASYGFWLGDAFASGGSVGYDHKAMGITAKGAWESVKRHFRELGVDTQTEEFTVVGVGDMSGDVFGNGMLLSEHIRLLAAFDHRHVFVDPDPDAARSFAERQRLFALPRSSWDDYDRSLISAGGGVWPRTAKSVPIGAGDARRARPGRATWTKLSPPELIAAILRAPGRPAVERRHRHLRQGRRRDRTPTRVTRPTTRSAPTGASCGSRSSARAATSG